MHYAAIDAWILILIVETLDHIANTEGNPNAQKSNFVKPHEFVKPIAELEKLVAEDKSTKDKKELLLEEIDHLEKVVARKVEDLRRQIEEL